LLANGLCVLLPPRVIIKCAEVLKWNSSESVQARHFKGTVNFVIFYYWCIQKFFVS